jgi:CRP/FNR family transcriptional regulator, cyclic AMP receptor protein
MANSSMTATLKTLEDPLAYLPHSTVLEYGKGQTIYDQTQASTSIYLVIDGKVTICRTAGNGNQVVLDIYQTDEFFGEAVLLGLSQLRTEMAITVENTKVMAWTTAQIEDVAARRPQLAVALLQLLVQRSQFFGQRIESFSVDTIARRLARALLRFSERMGHVTETGPVEMSPLTHELLAQYVGTRREIVTHHMNQFRRQGYLLYSRKGILVHQDMIRASLISSKSRKIRVAA